MSGNKNFKKTNILRLGFIWPGRKNSNLYKAIFSQKKDIKLNLNSSFYITPRSLILDYIKNKSNNISDSKIIGFLSSSNKVYLKDLLRLRNIDFDLKNDKNYLYSTKDKDNSIKNLVANNFNWEEKEDFNPLIAKALSMKGKEIILPFR